MRPILHALWIGGNLSKLEQISLASFVYHGHTVNLYTYDKVGNIPIGINVIDGNTIIDKSEIYTYPNGSYSAFSNLFRWEILNQKGGCWIDADLICLKPFDFNSEYIYGWQDSRTINGAVVGLPAGDRMAHDLAFLCRNPNTLLPYDTARDKRRKVWRRYIKGNRRNDIKWGEGGGVQGFSNYAKHNGYESHAQPFLSFYALQPGCWKALIDGSISIEHPMFTDSYAVHLWNERFRAAGYSKDGPFPENSFMGQAEKRFFNGLQS